MTRIISDLSEFAPAKINLSLRVTGRRADGYHLLHSLVAFCTIGDRVVIDPDARPGLSMSGDQAAMLYAETPDRNSVLRAARALCALRGQAWETGHLTLIKNLPVASGIGGGSADAAATLRLLCRIYGWDWDDPDVQEMALGLGADVPVCLRGQPVWMTGIGETLEPAPGLLPWPILLVNPGIGLATPAVFAARSGPFATITAQDQIIPTQRDEQRLWLANRQNDLEEAACGLVPEIRDLLTFLRQQPELCAAHMSGSGATCFALADDVGGLEKVAARLLARRPGCWVAIGHVST